MVKKSVEISGQCQLDFILIIYDKKFNRFKEVHTNRELTLDKVNTMLSTLATANSQIVKGNCPDPLVPKYKRVYARDLVEVGNDEPREEEELDEPQEE